MNKKIKTLRLSLGMTQTAFGEKCGVWKQTVQNWESGKHAPNDLAMHQIEKLNGGKPL